MKKRLLSLAKAGLFILVSGLFSLSIMAQDDSDCKLLMDWVDNEPEGTAWATWSYRFDCDEGSTDEKCDFAVVDNPDASGPVSEATVRKWTKGFGWTGIGAHTDDGSTISLDGYAYFSVWVYSEREMMDLLRLELKDQTQPEEEQMVIDYTFEYLGIPAGTWTKVKFPLESLFLGENKNITRLLMNPDGTNDSGQWNDNVYYFSKIFLESETGCTEETAVEPTMLPPEKQHFIYHANTLRMVSHEMTDLVIYSVLGQKVKELKNPAGDIHLSELDRGIYVVKSRDLQNNVITKKIVVQ